MDCIFGTVLNILISVLGLVTSGGGIITNPNASGQKGFPLIDIIELYKYRCVWYSFKSWFLSTQALSFPLKQSSVVLLLGAPVRHIFIIIS